MKRKLAVVPAYNEEASLPALLPRAKTALEEAGIPYHVILVNDGSADRTPEVAIQHAVRMPLTLVDHERNKGLGEALKSGLLRAGALAASHDVIVTMDADNTHPPDLIPAISEATVVPGNAGLSAVDREQRIALSWRPFQAAVEAVIAERIARRQETRLVSIHSFTPVYHGRSRPWQIGFIHDEDRRLAGELIGELQRIEGLTIGVNEPYSPADRVYFTHERHARPRGLACAMIEIRNDQIGDEEGQRRWADRLAGILSRIRPAALDNALPLRSRRL